jgi:flagellar hook-associated protein 3 FlgL
MTRVATVPLQRILSGGIQKLQNDIATSQKQLASGKRAENFAALGTDGVRIISAHSLLARQKAYGTVATRVGTTLLLYDANISNIDTATSTLRGQILSAIGTGQTTGLQEAIKTAFDQFRTALNATVDGQPLFGGSQTDASPFTAQSLADVATVPAASLFANDDVRAKTRVADGVDVQYGITASEIGGDLVKAFQTLVQAGTIGTTPTDAQRTALADAIAQIDKGLLSVRAVNADNGRRQGQVETAVIRSGENSNLLDQVISTNEDADLGQISIDLTLHQSILQASYSVLGRLSNLSLANYL